MMLREESGREEKAPIFTCGSYNIAKRILSAVPCAATKCLGASDKKLRAIELWEDEETDRKTDIMKFKIKNATR